MSSISSAISTDHNDIVKYYKNILDSCNDETAAHWYSRFAWALNRHLKAEEIALHPALRHSLGNKGRIIVEKNELERKAVSPETISLSV